MSAWKATHFAHCDGEIWSFVEEDLTDRWTWSVTIAGVVLYEGEESTPEEAKQKANDAICRLRLEGHGVRP